MSAAVAVTPSDASVAPTEDAATPASPEAGPPTPTSVREIHKNGWLKKLPSMDKRATPFTKPPKAEKMWVVFCIHDDVEAFLEYYENRRSAFSHRPTSTISLMHCLHISPNIVYQDNDFVFSITLESTVIKLAATSREQMMEWMDTLKGKLTELGSLQPQHNVYSKGPTMRDPNSPLPPTPPGFAGLVTVPGMAPARRITPPARSSEPSSPTSPFASSLASTYSESNIASRLSTSSLQTNISRPNLSLSLHHNGAPARHSQPPTPTSPSSTQPSSTVTYVRRPSITPPFLSARENQERSVPGLLASTHFTFDVAVAPTTSNTALPANSSVNCSIPRQAHPTLNSTATLPGTNHILPNSPALRSYSSGSETLPAARFAMRDGIYEPIFLTDSSANRVVLGGIRNPNYDGPPRPTAPPSADRVEEPGPPIQPRARSRSEERAAVPAVTHVRADSNYELITLGRSHTMARNETGTDENHRPLTLKEKQVVQLCYEIQHKAGVRLMLPRKDCINAIAFVECFGNVWVAGWKQREHPLLYHSFHIGDRVISIAGHNIHTAHDAHSIVKSTMAPKIEIVVGRIPFGQAFAIKRDFEGQDLGLRREGNTAEIVSVLEDGLAARHGLTAKTKTCDGDGLCNWVLTEVNGRPLNLFFKDSEVYDRLNAVGRDISILVQPSDFVKSLKKQLKAMWSYKEYIVQ